MQSVRAQVLWPSVSGPDLTEWVQFPDNGYQLCCLWAAGPDPGWARLQRNGELLPRVGRYPPRPARHRWILTRPSCLDEGDDLSAVTTVVAANKGTADDAATVLRAVEAGRQWDTDAAGSGGPAPSPVVGEAVDVDAGFDDAGDQDEADDHGGAEAVDQGKAQGDDGYRGTTATYNMPTVVAGMPERAVGGLDVDRGDDVRAGVDSAQDWAADRADDLHEAVDTTEGWARDRASDVGEGVSDVAGQVGGAAGAVADEVEDTVADLGRGVLNLADNPPWSR